jgi:predicted phosphodiesterase
MPALRIAVLADTHDHHPPGLPEQVREADEIWHLGDVCRPDTLAEFERLGPPLSVVMGNCDAWPAWPLELTLERAGRVFFLTHIPPPRAPPGAQVVLHGHTHLPRDEMRDGARWLNPGSVSRSRGAGRSFAWLTVEKDGRLRWQVVPL